ncbi:type I-E CRISPR-associated protein Cas5/CasD [Aeromonas simiae]|uniref:type I-E CRISPR-associated protein Cas5/CasD n=1 Tax=Aeromonas simiae TaxID=218936 RepID=UPI00266D1E00|nr:type I-E CRISPR-associated protein Cas5/CasD [Aeromonas simiae]MDO2947760.1 type I-E CRISPR-associated protein Cas5/CasD [Aeromonas simiae]MDO2952380.1 type I-E CRISPR-associated protein Cas5/CasD [Aeromonas simiae]MDO2954975.1 type I-E CRISPR-associated protein Cas5/CasD [Aeromonas simiae]
MPTLLLRLQGPLQSWGTTSRFDERDTQLEPSKSGVLGLICAALGRDRSEPVDDLAALTMGVRVDREGVVLRDYQTATGVINAAGKVDLKRTVVSPRYYLSDAAFLVGLEGDSLLLTQIHQALKRPHWPLSLGRKGCLPSPPVYLPDGLQECDLIAALSDYPELSDGAGRQVRRLLLEASEGAVRLDQPIAPFAERRFGPRFVTTLPLEPQEAPCS